jgi:hypothetical protein
MNAQAIKSAGLRCLGVATWCGCFGGQTIWR